ncbi:MAG TPA: PSD1 and planctomycete cytochrome C domain-containing protein [Gemmataceae bacterium]|nr:PSD1 and planctomycete cytochrome C domain-containing protein [Gemmataceae bacterium]
MLRPALLLALTAAPAIAADLPPPAGRRVEFERDVRPLLVKQCLACHGPDKQRGGLRLDRKADALKGGDDGPVLVPGKSADSPIIRLTAGLDPDRVMPPKGERLTAEQVGILRAWIDQGAEWPGGDSADPRDWWSLRPLNRPALPKLSLDDATRARNPVDRFVLDKLREKGLAPSPGADRRTLIRRLSFDLIGLPPTPDEIEAFLNDPTADAYERLVDRLLASPAYGERWARHWLDVVHYGDTHGYDKDQPRPNAWPYRDYVIRALNADKPYARFVQEQVAGDVLFPGTIDGVTALGFIAAGPWDLIGHVELPETKIDGKVARHLDRDDMVANTINTFASLTVQCAQCHNHKFDPITQEEYYRLQAVFAALDRADRPYHADPATANRFAELTAQRAGLRKWEALGGTMGPNVLAGARSARAAADAARAKVPAAGVVYAGTIHDGGDASFRGTGPDGGRPRPIFVLKRGDVKNPGKEVGPGTLAVIPELSAVFDNLAGHPEGERRAALARWLTDPRNPLPWRSIVNRVWQYHFGRGIVATPNDFGRMGHLQSHPELLDWLATEFRDGGQSLKALHRLLVTSATYRQVSIGDERFENLDSGNVYLWRMTRRKLEAEAVRDTALAAAGTLDRSMSGPAFRDFVMERPEHSPPFQYPLADPDDPKARRRSVYRFLVRSKPQPFMTVLDCADPSMQVEKRTETLSPLQALALFNNGFMLAQAKHLADRAGGVGEAFRLAIGREPTRAERGALDAYAAEHGLANACRVILNLNEFVFVD